MEIHITAVPADPSPAAAPACRPTTVTRMALCVLPAARVQKNPYLTLPVSGLAGTTRTIRRVAGSFPKQPATRLPAS